METEVNEVSAIQKYLTDDEIIQLLGKRLRTMRINKDMSVDNVSLKVGLNNRTILDIEHGRNVTLKSLVRYLRGIGDLNLLNAAFPYQTLDPLRMVSQTKDRKKAYGQRKPRAKQPEIVPNEVQNNA